MIRVHIDREDIKLTMDGHAGYAEAGSDIICAAASILVYTAASRLREITQGDGLSVRLAPGDAFIHADAPWQIMDECRSVLDTISAGFTLLSGKYPEYLSVETGGVTYSNIP